MSTEDTTTPMQRLVESCDGDVDLVGDRISGVLEFLTVRAALDAPFYIYADNKQSIVVIAANEDVEPIVEMLPEHFKNWDDPLDTVDEDIPPFDTNRDPGDEQEDSDESTPESE